MTYRAEVVIAPRVDYSGCAHLLIMVVPGLLPKDHEVFVLEKFGLCILLTAQTRSNSRDTKGLNASKRFACAMYGPKRPDFATQSNSVNWFKNDEWDQSIGLLLVAAVVRLVVHDPLPQFVALSIFSREKQELGGDFVGVIVTNFGTQPNNAVFEQPVKDIGLHHRFCHGHSVVLLTNVLKRTITDPTGHQPLEPAVFALGRVPG